MDVSISLVSCRRDYCINPSASLFFFSFFRRLSSFLLFFSPCFFLTRGRWNWQVTPLLYIIRFEGLLEAWIKLLNGRKTLLNVLCDIPLVSGIIHERFKSLNECFLSVVFNYISRRMYVCMYVCVYVIYFRCKSNLTCWRNTHVYKTRLYRIIRIKRIVNLLARGSEREKSGN